MVDKETKLLNVKMLALTLTPFLCLHSLWYWAVQQFSYRHLRWNVPLDKRQQWMEWVAAVQVDAVTILHTVFAFHATVMRMTTHRQEIQGEPLDIFQVVHHPSRWVQSQYALELVVYGSSLMKTFLGSRIHIMNEFIAHHSLAMALLLSSYAFGYTTIGMVILTITNATNLWFDYFKYGLITKTIPTKFVSSILFWSAFFIFRIYYYTHLVMIPLHTIRKPLGDKLVFGSMLYALYIFQLWWFYRLTERTFRYTRDWVYSLFNLSDATALIQDDLRQMMDHLKTIETRIHRHVHSHTIHTSLPLEISTDDEAEPAASGEAEPVTDDAVAKDAEATVKEFYEKIVSSKTMEEIGEMAERIMDEALGEWRSLMFKQLEQMQSDPVTDIPTITETDKKND